MKRAGILIAGVGNVCFGDDGFGVAVVRQLASEGTPLGTVAADFGIRGVHLAYELLEPRDLVVLIACVSRGAAPGTLCILDPDLDPLLPSRAPRGYEIDLRRVFETVRALGGRMPVVRIVGCEPADVEPRVGLSPAVTGAIPAALAMVRELVVPILPSNAPEAANDLLDSPWF